MFQLVITLALMLLFFNNEENIRDVMQRCSKILCFVAIVSLFFWLFGSILHVFNPSQELTIYVSDIPRVKQSYFFLQYEMQKEEILGHLEFGGIQVSFTKDLNMFYFYL